MESHESRMIETFTIAHFSDVHLSPVTGFSLPHWNAKRVLGYLNWQRGRKGVHLRSVADQLIADAQALRPDHFVITGDLINLGLPAEYDAALAWLQSAGSPEHVTVIPGNHDVYTRLKGHLGIRAWAHYMGSEPESLAFPFVRRLGAIALVGLNSAIETPPFVAAGRLGQHQIEVAGELLERLGAEGLVRIVLIHHPPLAGLANARRGLADHAIFERMLKRSGAQAVLYGHNHVRALHFHDAEIGAIPVVGAPSASAGSHHKGEPLAEYNLLTIFKSKEGVRMRHVIRGLDRPGGEVVKLGETVLNLPS
jgi:3',5'-cyclic AMP phosphodiesterase CpdA